MLVLAGGQLGTVGKHCQAAAAQRAPTSGSPPREKQRGNGDAQTGVTEQTVQIKMETQKEIGPPGSPRQEWRLGRAEAKAGAPSALKGASTSRVRRAQRRRPLQGLSPSGRRRGRQV